MQPRDRMAGSYVMSSGKPRIFSGMQPSGVLHIGNYLGALKNWATIQYDYEPIFCVVDQHAITIYKEPTALRESIEQVAALLHLGGNLHSPLTDSRVVHKPRRHRAKFDRVHFSRPAECGGVNPSLASHGHQQPQCKGNEEDTDREIDWGPTG